MKQAKTIQELAQEVLHQQEMKKDYVADTRSLVMEKDSLVIQDIGRFLMNGIFHSQLADKTGVPMKYYEKMRTESPDLLATNINHWLQNQPKDRMIRTLGNTARAFLGSGYRTIDNYDLMNAIVPTLGEQNLEIRSCDLTDRKLYLKATIPDLAQAVKVGDLVTIGVMISNSEVGCGMLDVSPFTENLSCTNGAVWTKYGMNRRHVGRKMDFGDNESARQVFSDEARQADDRAFFLKVRDVVKATCTREMLDKLVDQMKEAQDVPIRKPIKSVEIASKKLNLTKDEQENVLEHLVNGGDLTSYGLAQAVTRTAQDAESYDRATELESLGTTVIEQGERLLVA